jgi:hypothetical protein
MTPPERLILYVTQRITDEDAVPSRTRLLKIIYLIDTEYFRRHRKTLTGWKWIFYYYGPYVMDFPKLLERLDIAGLDETVDHTATGKKFYKYQIQDMQSIEDLVAFSEQTRIDGIIKRWALDDLNLLLNYVYFETEPMRDAKRGEPLDFNKIPRSVFVPVVGWSEVSPSKEQVARFRKMLAELIKKTEENRAKTKEIVAHYPFIADGGHLKAIREWGQEAQIGLPDGTRVSFSE